MVRKSLTVYVFILTLMCIYDNFTNNIRNNVKKRLVVNKKNGLYKLLVIGMITAFILSSCSAAPIAAGPTTLAVPPTASNSTEVPTNAPAVTATAVPVSTDTSTPAATATQEVTSPAATTVANTPVAQVVPTLNAYCRKGPGIGYHAITFLMNGTAYNVIGRDSQSTWWQIQAPGNVTCWVVGTSMNKQGAVEQASIVQVPPLPETPAQFEVSTYKCDIASKTLTVTFDWSAAEDATSYIIYRNGTQLAEVGPTVLSYSDNAPLRVNLVYELEALNDYGVAPRISKNVLACQ
jgi:uncharacterized protein YgiM (DUF1202 family)